MIKPLPASTLKKLARHEVPDWVRGVWKRTRLRREGESIRGGARIIWIQTPILFADIRVPAPKDTDGMAEGFAGHNIVRGMVCSWQRPIDLNPVGEPGDEGAMFRDGDAMLETGIHANYVEEWKLIGAGEPHLAMTRGRFDVTAEGVVWDTDETLEIAVACNGHVIHAWREGGHAGLVCYTHNPATDTLKPVLSAGTPHNESPREWRLWSGTMDNVTVAAMAELLA